ncbi:unnamed protein product, partial [Prorocentrum cordatum]
GVGSAYRSGHLASGPRQASEGAEDSGAGDGVSYAAWSEPDDFQDQRLLDELREWSQISGSPDFLSFFGLEPDFSGTAEAKPNNPRGAEVCLKKLTPAEREQFIHSDQAEWDAIVSSGAARVLSVEESSTVAAETLALSGATAEAQWLQVLWRDSVFGDVPRPEWFRAKAPFSVMLSSQCQLSEAAQGLAVVDAKSVFDTLSRNSAGSRADRRNAVELAVIRDSLAAVGSRVRWVPHGRMPADPLTKMDPGRGSLALHDLLCRGSLVLVDEHGAALALYFLELNDAYHIPPGWWARQPRATLKTGWITFPAHASAARRAELQVAVCRMGLVAMAQMAEDCEVLQRA